MKKIAVFTMGTRGDVQPYIYLAQALTDAGYEVTLGSHPCWKSLIEKSGVLFVPIGPDIDIEREASAIRSDSTHPVVSMLKTMNFIFRIVQNSSPEIFDACKGKDLIIVSHSQMAATEAEVLGIPTVNVTLQTEMIPEKLKAMKPLQKALGKLIASQAAKPYNKVRKRYNLPKVNSMDEVMSNRLNLIPISRHFIAPSPYWEPQHQMTGFWYTEDKEYAPDTSLATFLENGEKPVILALGAMSFEAKKEEDKLSKFIRAFEITGTRAIIQGFQMTLKTYTLPKSMLAVGPIPHSYLFRKGWCVIHHCGFGTSAASLIYGIPSIPVPHILDQFANAERLVKIGAAVPPIKASDLTEQRIVDAIMLMRSSYAEKFSRVTELSELVKAEHGLDKSVELINQIMGD
ncbi:MAG: glycosyltransferase family 1 protein [Chloroflexi bacterium]|nr:glycosyltransferase family 1 protein [Chloroflexota bacterium]